MPTAEPSVDCPFCGIAAGRHPAHIIAESPDLLAFLDADPIRSGHLQIMPRAHFPSFNALPEGLAREMLDLGERLARLQRAVFAVDRVGFLFAGGEFPHAHTHLVPLLSAGDVTARRRRTSPALDARGAGRPPAPELAVTAWRLRRELSSAVRMVAMP